MSEIEVFLQGLLLCGALIVAIGAQNAFVLRQGARCEHVLQVVAFCSLMDAVLIAAGVTGLGRLLSLWPGLETALTAGGALFLGAYGLLAARRAWRPGALAIEDTRARAGWRTVLAQAAAFTLLNPHVYLDTVLLVGAVGAQQAPPMRPWFIAGGASASLLWFSALGAAARALGPWLSKPAIWRWIEAGIAVVMLWLAITLLLRLR